MMISKRFSLCSLAFVVALTAPITCSSISLHPKRILLDAENIAHHALVKHRERVLQANATDEWGIEEECDKALSDITDTLGMTCACDIVESINLACSTNEPICDDVTGSGICASVTMDVSVAPDLTSVSVKICVEYTAGAPTPNGCFFSIVTADEDFNLNATCALELTDATTETPVNCTLCDVCDGGVNLDCDNVYPDLTTEGCISYEVEDPDATLEFLGAPDASVTDGGLTIGNETVISTDGGEDSNDGGEDSGNSTDGGQNSRNSTDGGKNGSTGTGTSGAVQQSLSLAGSLLFGFSVLAGM